MTMSHIVILGGHGKVALLAAPLLIAAGHTVTSIIRNPDQVGDVDATGATPLVADIETLDTARISDLLAGTDVVVWSAGAGGGSPERTYAVDRDAAIRSMDAARRAGVSRYVMVSWLGSVDDHGVDPNSSFFPYADAKLAADNYLRGTDIDWTILGPGALTLEPPTGAIKVLAAVPMGGENSQTSRGNVAAVIAAVVDAPVADVSRRFIGFTDGQKPIAEAVLR